MSSETEHAAPIRAILFDYGMVLSGPPNVAAWERMRSITSFDEAAMRTVYWTNRHAYDAGTLSGVQYWTMMAAEGGIPEFTSEQVTGLVDADTELWTDLNEPMVAWARGLERAGIRTGILSNIGDEMEAGVLRKHPWLGEFGHVTWSHRLKTAKPDLAIYRHAAEGLQVSPFHVLFIDDKLENLVAARETGMQTVQYSTHAGFVEEMRHRGFESLLEDLPRLPGA